MPSTKIFTMTDFDFATLEHRLRELAFLNSGVRLALSDARSAEPKTIEMHYEGGLVAFVNYLDRTKTALIEPPVVMSAERDGLPVERSEEHTSELQSLMRSSYAVFCLKKKNTCTPCTNDATALR